MTSCNNNNKIDTRIRKLESKPFLFFFRDHLRSTLGITCGRGSFAVHFGDHLRSRDHLRYCTVVPYKGHLEFSGAFFLAEIVEKVSFDPHNFRITKTFSQEIRTDEKFFR